MPEFLQADLAIGYVDKETGEVKATPYFEELLFGYLQQMGGESENLIDNSVNVVNTLSSTIEVKISDTNRKLDSLDQRIEAIPRPVNNDFGKRITELEQLGVSPSGFLHAVVENLARKIDTEQKFTASGVILPTTDLVFVSGAGVTLTMPATATVIKRVTIKNTDVTNDITLDTPGSELIEGFTTSSILHGAPGTPGTSHTYAYDGTEWRLV